MKARLACLSAGAGLAITLSWILASPARADGPVDQGWWTSTTPSGLPVNGVAPPDVPAEGLLVQGGPGATTGPTDTGATAYAALVFGLAPNSTVGSLTLNEVGTSLSTPNAVLQLCPLTDTGFASVAGGPISAAPPYDCNQNVTAQVSISGSTFTFAVAKLVSGNQLAVAVLPTSAIERVVLAAPGGSALAVAAGSSSTDSVLEATPSTVAAPSIVPTSTPQVTTPSSVPVSTSPVVSASPATGRVVAGPAVAPLGNPATATTPSSSPNPSQGAAVVSGSLTGTKGTNPAAMIIAVMLALLGGAAWLLAGRSPASGQPLADEGETPP